jgi:hypothetical protein
MAHPLVKSVAAAALVLFMVATAVPLAHALTAARSSSARSAAPAGSGNLTTATTLPGDTGIAPAAGKQENSQIARGSNGFLTVWADTRTALAGNSTITVGGAGPYFGPGLGRMGDIFAARVDQAGNVIDQHPIVISSASYSQGRPQVAWNGENWLVVWYEEVENDRYNFQIRGVRVSPAGVVLDATPFVISTPDNNLGGWPTRVVFDGTNWIVLWQGFSSPTARAIFAARVTAAGTVLDPGGVAVYTHPSQFLTDPDIAYNGSGYLVIFLDISEYRLYGQRLSPTLQQVGSRFMINNFNPSRPVNARVASNGDSYFVAWDEHPFSGNIGSLNGTRITASGQVLDPASIVIDANVGTSETAPSVTWDGTNWAIAYESGYEQQSAQYSTHNIYLKRVSSAGAVVNPLPIHVSTAPSHQVKPVITLGFNGAVQIVWDDLRVEQDIYTAQVSAAGAVSNEIAASRGAPRQSEPHMAMGGGVFMTVFTRATAGNPQIFAQRLDASGNPLDAEPFLVSSLDNVTNANPSIAWNGTTFLVVWDRQEADEFGNIPRKVYGRRISAGGVLQEAAPFYIQDGLTPDVAALGDTFLSVAIRRQGNEIRWVEAVRVSSAGAVLGPVTLVETQFNFAPRVVALGARWLVVWEYHSRHDRSTSWTRAAFVEPSGALSAPSFQVALSDSPFGTGNSYDDTPDVAVSGNEALIVWADNDNNTNDIKGRLISADGTLLGSNFGFTISSAAGSQLLPSVTWNGTEYVVAWLDHRSEQFPAQPRGDIYAARVSAAGAVLDADGFPVANTPTPEDTPFVIGHNGLTLFAYSAYYDHSPYSAMRVTLRRSFSSPGAGATAVSRKMHGAMGAGDIPLPLTGGIGIEPRSAGAGGAHQIVVTFPAAVTVSNAQVTSGTGTVVNMTVSGSQVTVDLAGVANAQRLTVTLIGVNNTGDVAIPMAVLLGDTNRSSSVNSSDVSQAKSMSGQTANATNFHVDVNLSGGISSSDISLVKAQSGTGLP